MIQNVPTGTVVLAFSKDYTDWCILQKVFGPVSYVRHSSNNQV